MSSGLDHLLSVQCGVVARWQLLELGLRDQDIRRRVRRREWAVVHPGVYVDHTGPLTWTQRAWAAVLTCWPSALSHDSALRAADGPGRRDRFANDPIHIAIGPGRKVVARRGLVIHRISDLDRRTLWNTSPPRLRVEEAVLDLAAEAHDPMSAIATLADAVQARRTRADRLQAALAQRPRIARRQLLEGVLRDVAEGTCSALEHGYLTLVERPHRLPRPDRQRPSPLQRTLRDVDYDAFGMVVELDGRLFHNTARARDADLERDLDSRVLDGRLTVRLGWGQIFDRGCSTAAKLGRLLAQQGWTGQPRVCPRCA